MDLRRASPVLERHWAEEVLHLHSLWRQGPPRNPNPNPNTNPSLRPVASAVFKESTKKQKRKRKQRKDDQPDTGIEWPCPPSPAPRPEDATWDDIATPPAAAARPVPSADEQARTFAAGIQNKALRACEGFFSKKDGSDEDVDDEEKDSMDEEDGKVGAFEFFLGLFEKEGDLREYYEKNYEKGEFCCLVCGGIGAKKRKKFGSCVGLVQHSNSISKTKRRGAHRAFARAVCRVLGWDIDRLPSIVLDTGDSLGQTLAKESNHKEGMQKEASSEVNENLSNKKQEIPQEGAGNMGINSNDLRSSVERDIEALPSENLQKGQIDRNENNDDTECVEIKDTDELPNELPVGDCCVDSNDGTVMGNSSDTNVAEIAG